MTLKSDPECPQHEKVSFFKNFGKAVPILMRNALEENMKYEANNRRWFPARFGIWQGNWQK